MYNDGQKYYLFYFIPSIYFHIIIIIIIITITFITILYFVKKTEVTQNIFLLNKTMVHS